MHDFDALVGHKPVHEAKAKELGLTLIYESDFVIIPIIEEHVYHYEIENNLGSTDYGEDIFWDTSTIAVFAKLLGFERYVIMALDTPDFLGSYYENGQKMVHEAHINTALQGLGVPKAEDSEFNYLNLNDYRNSEFFYMNPIVGHRDTSHIIPGRRWDVDYGKI